MSAAQVTAFAMPASSLEPVMNAAHEHRHASCAMANCVAMRHVSVGLSRTPISSWTMKRVTATELGKQHAVSSARHSSGALRSPHRPLHGNAPCKMQKRQRERLQQAAGWQTVTHPAADVSAHVVVQRALAQVVRHAPRARCCGAEGAGAAKRRGQGADAPLVGCVGARQPLRVAAAARLCRRHAHPGRHGARESPRSEAGGARRG